MPLSNDDVLNWDIIKDTQRGDIVEFLQENKANLMSEMRRSQYMDNNDISNSIEHDDLGHVGADGEDGEAYAIARDNNNISDQERFLNYDLTSKSLSRWLFKQGVMLSITGPMTLSFIMQTYQFFNDNENDSTWLKPLRIPATVASPLLNLLLSQFWLKDIGVERYRDVFLVITFFWALLACMPTVENSIDSMEKLNIGNEKTRDVFKGWLAIANAVVFIKPVALVVRQISEMLCMSEKNQRKLYYKPEGYCRDSLDKLLSELDLKLKFRRDLNEIDREFFKMAVNRAAAQKINEGRGSSKKRFAPLIDVLEKNAHKFDKIKKLEMSLAFLCSAGYAVGSLPEIAKFNGGVVSFLADKFGSSVAPYECSDRLTTFKNFPATIPNLFFDAICIYQSWVCISLMCRQAMHKNPILNMGAVLSCMLIALLTCAPSLLQAGFCEAYSKPEKLTYQGLTLIDTASVNFAGLTDEDVDLKIFLIEFVASCITLYSLMEMYDHVEFESAGLFMTFYALQMLESSIKGVLSCCRNTCAEYRDNKLLANAGAGAGLAENFNASGQDGSGQVASNDDDIQIRLNRLKERVKVVKEVNSDLRAKLFSKQNEGAISYYQKGDRTGFFENILDNYMHQGVPAAAPLGSVDNQLFDNSNELGVQL